jgi:hypothetical protein
MKIKTLVPSSSAISMLDNKSLLSSQNMGVWRKKFMFRKKKKPKKKE